MESVTRSEPGIHSVERAPSALALTVIAHPRLGRIGDRALLSKLQSGDKVRLSRSEPEFSQPRQGRPRPLKHSSLSRQPIVLKRLEDGSVLLDVADFSRSVSVDGILVTGQEVFSAEDVAKGIILTLAGQVVLFLHPMERVATLGSDLGFVGESAAVVKIRNQIQNWADLPDPILILGETGTGKELAANALASLRGGPYIRFSITDIPSTLAAAELFGAEAGAFDGIRRRRDGAFRAADGGTLFLDEIAEASPEIQGMLLRVLAQGEVKSLGSDNISRIDVRVLAATDQNLESAAEQGSFRTQLLHRLRGHDLLLPPLRERLEDLGRLFVHFLRQRLEELPGMSHFDDQTDCMWLPGQVLDRLMRYHWPGNVRQLKKVTDRIGSTLQEHGWDADAGVVLGSFEALLQGPNPKTSTDRSTGEQLTRTQSLPTSVDAETDEPDTEVDALVAPRSRRYNPAGLTREDLLSALDATDWNYTHAAKKLNISRGSIYNHLERLGLRTTKSLTEDEILNALEAHGNRVEATARALSVSSHGLLMRMKALGLR